MNRLDALKEWGISAAIAVGVLVGLSLLAVLLVVMVAGLITGAWYGLVALGVFATGLVTVVAHERIYR